MKQLKVSVNKKGKHDRKTADNDNPELRILLERLKKKGLNPMQMCQKLQEHKVAPPSGEIWSYDLVVDQCKKLKIN
ncbi:MAG: hypothetical protein PUP46_01130 [Endozoicomonas sp. (ex Botrylloides leachii)]|nr:hypothetical protein [Endozoicomonas sp. (ex Botrylloides leachii)]